MATSASVNFLMTRDDMIKYAYKKAGITGEGETPTATQVTEAAMLLNMIAKSWNAMYAMPLWTKKTGYVLPQSSVASVTFDSVSASGGSHVATTYVSTTLAANAAASATALTVTSITGISTTHNLGIELDDNTIQ